MSVLIKGIDIKEIKFGAVAIMNIDDVAYFVRSDDIVAIPDHGDLIDRDLLVEMCDDPHWCVWLNEIEDAPAVIPAERSE